MPTEPRICWLASYPKSGNTWVRFILIHLIHGPQRDTSAFEQLIPDLHEGIDPARLDGGQRLIVKSHLMFSESMPLATGTERFVYIVRHPLDVLASNLDYLFLANYERIGSLSERERSAIVDRYVDAYIDNGGDSRWLAFGMGSWVDHVGSWTVKASGVPGLAIRYEDLIHDTASEVRRLRDFLELEATDADVERAVAASSFENMRSMEETEIRDRRCGFFCKGNFRAAHERGYRFMSRGKIGRGRNLLSPAQLERADRAFAPHAERWNYEIAPEPVARRHG